jgi:hypothetical protein
MKYKKTCRNSSALIKNSEKQLTFPKFIYYFQFMNLGIKYQGKIATTDDVEFINKLIAENPTLNYSFIILLTPLWVDFWDALHICSFRTIPLYIN